MANVWNAVSLMKIWRPLLGTEAIPLGLWAVGDLGNPTIEVEFETSFSSKSESFTESAVAETTKFEPCNDKPK